jgi:hypothetical protein
MVTPNNARKSTPCIPPPSKLTSENEDIVLVSTSVDGDTTTSTSSTNQEEEGRTCVVATGTLARPPCHSYSPKYTPQKKKKLTKEQALKDPRGLVPLDYTLPSTGYCSVCRCRFHKCHEVVFGEFCELYIVNEVEYAHWYLVDEYIEEIFTGKYSEALQFKVHEQMGKYDGRKGGYKLPDCVRNNALARSLKYGNFHT